MTGRTFPLVVPSLETISALFCQFCELNVHIFVRNFQFFNFFDGIHNSAMVFSAKEQAYGRVRFPKEFAAKEHRYLPWEGDMPILSVFT